MTNDYSNEVVNNKDHVLPLLTLKSDILNELKLTHLAFSDEYQDAEPEHDRSAIYITLIYTSSSNTSSY